MKKLLFAVVLAQLCGLQLFAQESSVKILLNDEERFRFDSIRLEFINSGHHVMIGDSTGMDNTANFQTEENTFIGHRAGSINKLGNWNTFIGARAGENHVEGDDNLFLGAWAGRFDSSGNQNTYVGTAAGLYSKAGQFNTYVGWCAGVFDSSGRNNVFIGRETGLENTGRLNAFVGTNAGYRNSSGSENTFLGTSSGGFNTTGNFNTYIGRRAGRYNQTGSGNVCLGYYAGANELGSSKLYIANSDTIGPLIYGDFELKKLKFYADSVQATGVVHSSGEVRTDQQFNASGNPGITDTVNSITDIDFSQQKYRYQTTIYSGGIATFISLESEWVDTIIENLVPCGKIGLVGEFNNWTDDVFLTWNAYMDLWTLSVKFTIADDHSYPVDSIVEVKFREYAGWDVNWGSAEFPAGTGHQGGENIPVTLSDSEDTTLYFINFNCRTGAYSFTDLTGYCGDSIMDSRDGRKYATVLIGNQCWMAENLNASKYRNDDIIPNVSDGTTWSNLTSGAFCWYNNDSATYENIYGKLYNWFALVDIRGLCPTGWHGPTDAEWTTMTDYLGGLSVAGGKLKEAGTTHWQSPNTGATNESGFTALPGGGRYNNGSFDFIGQSGYWWSATEGDAPTAYDYSVHFDSPQVSRYNYYKSGGDAVRCLKDD